MPGIENKPYLPAVEEFLRDLQELDVQALVMVALCGDEDVHDSVGTYRCGPFELAAAAGILQMHSCYRYQQIQNEADDEENEEE